MKTYRNKYKSEQEAKDASDLMLKNFCKEDCTITKETRAIVVVRPDQVEGVVTVRYEW